MFEETPDKLIDRIYVSESFTVRNRELYETKVKAHPYEVVEDGIFRRLSDTNNPQGVLVTVHIPEYDEDRFIDDIPAGDCLVLNRIQDPGNLGTMIRTAEAAGMSAVIMDEGCADIFNPKVIRSTMGSVYRVPFLVTGDLGLLMSKMKDKGFCFVAGDLKGTDFFEAKRPEGYAGILIGNEGNGLDEEILEASDIRLRIPMEGEVSSLNAAVSAALFMFFLRR